MLKEFNLETHKRESFTDITRHIASCISSSGFDSGVAFVYVPHTTAAVTINENADPDVKRDMIEFLNKLIPVNWDFTHFEGNSDAHIKASLLGMSLSVPFSHGKMVLGTWQGIYFCEFDGPRRRKYIVKIISD